MQNLGGLICGICLDYFVQPVTAKCSHSFCQFCINEYFLHFEECPICQQSIRLEKMYTARALMNFVQNFIDNKDPQSKGEYLSRCKQRKQQKAQRSLQSYKVGMKIDVRDSDFKWNQAIIIRIISRVGQVHKFIKIQYLSSQQKVQEDIKVNSQRLAKHQAYTSRTDLQKKKK